MITNPKTLHWANATQGTNSAGAVVAWDPSADMAGIQVAFDGQPGISVPTSLNATSLDLTTVAPFVALAAGQHTITIADVTKEGVVGVSAPPVPFLAAVVPLAPTLVTLA